MTRFVLTRMYDRFSNGDWSLLAVSPSSGCAAQWALAVVLVCGSTWLPAAVASEVVPTTCTGNVATCVANAADGAVVTLGEGTHSWTTEVALQGNKHITIVGAGQGLTTLDRNSGGRFFTIPTGCHVVLKHSTVVRGVSLS